MQKRLYGAFAAAAALISTPALAADTYTLKDNKGTEVSVMEVTQSDMKEIVSTELDSQKKIPYMSQQDVYRAKVLYNWHIQAFLRDVAMAMGFDKNKSNSMGASIAQIAGRYIVENDMEMDFQAFEFNPYDNKPVNGWSPAAQPAQSKYDDGTGYRAVSYTHLTLPTKA